MKDYYAILGVSKDATEKEIKKAYRKLSMKHHPDKGGDADKFTELNEANEILSDANKRANYDNPPQQAGGFGFGGFSFGGSMRQAQQINPHITVNITISLEECFTGADVNVNYDRLNLCTDCNGEGGSNPSTCSECGGQGHVRFMMGNTEVAMECRTCEGSGQMNIDPCNKCNSTGFTKMKAETVIKLPPSLLTGSILRVAGGGNQVGGGQAGELRIKVKVDPHPIFEHESLNQPFNLVQDLDLTYPEMVLGCEKTVPNIEGKKLKITIPPLSQNGAKLRLKGQGLFHRSSREVKKNRGDMTVEVWVKMPTNLSESEEEAIRQLQGKIEEKEIRG